MIAWETVIANADMRKPWHAWWCFIILPTCQVMTQNTNLIKQLASSFELGSHNVYRIHWFLLAGKHQHIMHKQIETFKLFHFIRRKVNKIVCVHDPHNCTPLYYNYKCTIKRAYFKLMKSSSFWLTAITINNATTFVSYTVFLWSVS